MKIVIAIDKFKGSATSQQLADAIEAVLREEIDQIDVVKVPVADGGDGTMRAIKAIMKDNCRVVTLNVPACLDCLPPLEVQYLLDRKGTTAFMDLATASGLALVPLSCRDVTQSSTYGTGMMMAHAIQQGVTSIVLGLGGSATCDGGTGLLAALGCEFFDSSHRSFIPCGSTLADIAEIGLENLEKTVEDVNFTALTDVDNPLLGPNGAAAVFAPQKGATPQQVEELEKGLSNFARFLPSGIAAKPGSGAAGGVGGAMAGLLSAEIKPGIGYLLELSNFEELIADSQLIITGEGRIDQQTAMGKAPSGVLNVARRHNIPVVALCGSVSHQADVSSMGFARVIEVTPKDLPLQQAIETSTTLSCVRKAIKGLCSEIKTNANGSCGTAI